MRSCRALRVRRRVKCARERRTPPGTWARDQGCRDSLHCSAYSSSSTLLWWELPDVRRKAEMDRGIDRLVLGNFARRERPQIIPVPPVPRRSDGPGNKSTPTIRTNISDHFLNTCRAKRAFERAYTRFQRIRRKRLVAVLARRSERECFNDVELLFGKAVCAPDFFLCRGHGESAVGRGLPGRHGCSKKREGQGTRRRRGVGRVGVGCRRSVRSQDIKVGGNGEVRSYCNSDCAGIRIATLFR